MRDITKDSLYRISQAFRNEPDRSVAILGSALIEDQLGSMLGMFLVPDTNKAKLFATYGPLSTFSARTEMAYLLGLIPKDIHDDIDYVRKIRNHFAHKIENVSFDKSPVFDLATNLRAVEWFMKGMSVVEKPPSPTEIQDILERPRRRFEITVGIVSIMLDHYLTSIESLTARNNEYSVLSDVSQKKVTSQRNRPPRAKQNS